MKKQYSLGTVISLVLIAVLLTFQATLLYTNLTFEKKYDAYLADKDLFYSLFEVSDIYHSYYLHEMDPELLSRYMIYGFLTGAGDKYANYLTAEELSAYQNNMNGNHVGIGVITSKYESYVQVVTVMPSSPAASAGVQIGDLIVGVDDITVAKNGYAAVEAALNTPVAEGQTRSYTFLRNGSTYTESITHAAFKSTTVFARTISANTGIVRITEFDNTTTADFKKALDGFVANGITDVVFDMRKNPGGTLTAVTECLDLLLPEGKITTITDRAGTVVETISSDAEKYNFQIAVLVNDLTASAGELFSCALQDYAKEGLVDAKLFGSTTYGKGTMQQVILLDNGGAISISTHFYNPPLSQNYEGIGVIPDHIVALDDALKNKHVYTLTDAEDNQLQAALSHLSAA